jgi:hypothetical protein
MAYVLFFLGILWYTLGALVICGLAVSLFRKLFLSMMGGGIGRGMVLATSIIGTPIHELGHALMCLLFGHRISAMSLWQPRSKDGNLGYVTHTYRRRNLYHILGNLFIGIGPIFSGLAVLALALRLGFPTTFTDYTEAATRMASDGESGLLLFLEGLKMLPHMWEELLHGTNVSLWIKIPAALVILSVSQHISLSPADIKGALNALPLYAGLALLISVVCGLLGQNAMDAVTGALARFSAYMTAFFVIVLVTALLQLLIALPVWLLRKLCGK